MSCEREFKILLARARSGEPDAFTELLQEYNIQIMDIIRVNLGRKLRGKLESMDIYQTTMKSAFRCLDQFQGESPAAFMKWITRILINDIRDKAHYFDKEKRRADREHLIERERSEDDGLGAVLPADNTTPSRQLIGDEKQKLMDDAIGALPEEQQSVVLLKKQGKSRAEIAAIVGVGERTVTRRYAEALVNIREFMERRGYGETD